ncbi:MAG: cohesin domain-containing protein [Clostridiales bacterium]|nr:cohesin domain-containing protein [Clostridiales bacterium]
MKLAKTLLACIVALVLVASCVSAMAATTATVNAVADKSEIKIGDEVTVTVSISNAAGFESGAAWLSFDTSLLELVSTDEGDTKASVVTTYEADEIAAANADGQIHNSFAYTRSETKDSVSIYTATFKAKANGVAKFGFVAGELLNLEVGSVASVTIADATTAAPTTAAPTTAAPTTAAPTTAAPTTKAPTTAAPKTEGTTAPKTTPKTGDASMAIVAGLAVLAGAAFVASKKSK